MCLIGLFSKKGEQNLTLVVDGIFSTPERIAESLLRNWRWSEGCILTKAEICGLTGQDINPEE